MALELLTFSNIEIESIVCTSDWSENHKKILQPFESKLLLAKPKEMEQITALKTANDVLLVVRQLIPSESKERTSDGLSLYLDNIQNPGNFGTIIRIADWFGITTVFCSKDSADLYNPKVVQSTMGAFLRVRVVKKDFDQLIADYPQLPVYGTVLEGENLFQTALEDKGIIVIGNEGKGISQEIRPFVTKPITIPSHPDGGAESLNAAVATGIVCAAFRNRK